MKPANERSWGEVAEDELREIKTRNPDRHVRRMARIEMKKRQRAAVIQTRTVKAGNPEKVEIVGIHLTAGNLLSLVFKALPAVIVLVMTIWLVQLMLNILMMNMILEGVIQEIEPLRKSLEQMQREFQSQGGQWK